MEIMNQFEKQLWFHNRKEGQYNSYGDKTGGGLAALVVDTWTLTRFGPNPQYIKWH